MKISDIADIINVTEKEPSNSGIDIFVGLEHYDIAEPVIKRYGSTKMLSTAAKIFEAGDVLIARRNVYLQRASVARFAGLTSGDSIVLRVKKDLNLEGTNYKTICKLLPFILNSINFWDYANTNADGTMSKRLSPAMLLDYEFNLPSIDEQKVLAEKLWAAYEVKQSYLKMIDATDEMVKAQFVEMFGDPLTNPLKWDVIPLSEFGECKNGMNFSTKENGFSIKCLGVSDFGNNSIIDNLEVISTISLNAAPSNDYLLQDGDIVFVRSNGNKDLVGRSIMAYPGKQKLTFSGFCIRFRLMGDKCEYINPIFLLCLFKQESIRKKLAGRGANINNLNQKILSSLMIIVPPLSKQIEYVDIVQQADKSKAELRKSIDAIDKVIKSLINENL